MNDAVDWKCSIITLAGIWRTWIDPYSAGFGEDTVPRFDMKGKYIFAIHI